MPGLAHHGDLWKDRIGCRMVPRVRFGPQQAPGDRFGRREIPKGRNSRRWLLLILLLTSALFLLPGSSYPWGLRAHRWVNRQAFRHLPPEMAGFRRWAGIITAYAGEADRRKATDPLEGPRHYIDIDLYPEFHRGRLSRDLDSLRARHGGRLDVYGNGVVPWTVAGVTETLSVAMAEGRWQEAVLLAADLGHYVADGHQPLHVTENYDGQLTGNQGVHLRYEIHMVNRHLDEFPSDSTAVSPASDPLDSFMKTIPGTWIYVDSIMAADHRARKRTALFDEEYYRIMWQHTGGFTIERLCQAARVLAALWLTAWVDAGRPAFPPPDPPQRIASLCAESRRPSLVTVQGVITLAPGILQDRWDGAYLQDASGRGIRLDGGMLPASLAAGDEVAAEGLLVGVDGAARIVGPSVSILKRECPLPPAPLLTTCQARDSCWDHTLIRISGSVVFILQDESWTRLYLNDGSGAVVVMISDATGIDRSRLREGDMLTVSGVGIRLEGEGERAVIPVSVSQITVQESGELDTDDLEKLEAMGYID